MTNSADLLDRVSERDLDLMLASALHYSSEFRRHVLRGVSDWTGDHTSVSLRVSETADAGETDVLWVVDLNCDERLAAMFENKISAVFQPAQAARYGERGRQGISDGRWTRFVTCLVAPENYLVAARRADEWDAYVSLEAICDWASESGDRHFEFVAAICGQAIAKRAAKQSEVSEDATAFWAFYREFAAELLPGITISRLPDAVTRFSPWPRFGVSAMKSDLFLEHKPQQGRVDLTFDRCSIEDVRLRVPSRLPVDMVIKRAGKSSAISVQVPRIDHLMPFEQQYDAVLSAFSSIERLFAIARDA